MSTARIGDVELYYEEHGSGEPISYTYPVGGRTVHPSQGHTTPGEGQGGYLRCRHRESVHDPGTAAALRAIEIRAEVLLMAKNKVDGVYTADPNKDASAKKLEHLDHREALKMGLHVMDATAFSLCMENNLPIVVFGLHAADSIKRAVARERIGTVVSSGVKR